MLVVELGFKLDKSYIYYENILKKNGLKCIFECATHDIYFTSNDFSNIDNMSEKQIKESCIRIRQVNDGNFEVQNNLIDKLKIKSIKSNKYLEFENKLKKYGYRKVFDTLKFDYQWFKDDMTARVQLQEIKDIGLLVYLDNEAYYELAFEEQRKKLIDELNSYGFSFKYDDLGLDKLRTLYYREEKYSNNQNA